MTGARLIKQLEEQLAGDPNNTQLLQKLGEAHQKRGDMPKAADYFIRVGEQYAGDGFFLKAVALLKQCIKLDPSRNDVNLRLAELHLQLQLHAEALAYAALFLPAATRERDMKGCLRAARVRVQASDAPAFRLYLMQLLLMAGAAADAAIELPLLVKALEDRHADLAASARAIEFRDGAATSPQLAQIAAIRTELARREALDQALSHLDHTQRN